MDKFKSKFLGKNKKRKNSSKVESRVSTNSEPEIEIHSYEIKRPQNVVLLGGKFIF